VYRNFAAMYTTWTGFINRRLKEDLTLPEHLGECKSLSGALCVYGAYWRTAVAQYQTASRNSSTLPSTWRAKF
jgi:hypothetical protein